MPTIFAWLRWRWKTRVARLRNFRTPRPNLPPGNKTASAQPDADQQLVAQLARQGPPSLRQLRHVGKLLTRTERRLITALAALALGCAVFWGLRFSLKHVEIVPLEKGSYTEGVIGPPQFINPLLSQSTDVDADLTALVFCGLFRYDRHVQPVPELATDYRVSPDGRTYVVQLPALATWHDGAPITPEDVVFTFTSVQNPDFHSPLVRSFRGVQVAKTGDREVTFTLAEPSERFLDLLTTGLLPEHRWGEIPPIHSTLTEYNLNPIGCGRWRFKSLVKDRKGNVKSYTLVPFAEYVGPAPYLQELTFKFYPKPSDAVAALNQRTVDGIGYVAPADDDLLTDPRVKRYTLALPQYTAIFFNPGAHASLSDKVVREALAAAIDRAKILAEALRLRGEAIEGPILPHFPGYDPELKAPAFDPARAEQLLDSAGWERVTAAAYVQFQPASSTAATTSELPTRASGTTPRSQDGLAYYRRGRDNTWLELTLTTVDRPENVATAELVREFWQQIGVKVSLMVVPDGRIARDIIKPRNYQVLLFGEAFGNDPDPYLFWHSSQVADPGLNLAGVANRHIDQLLEAARAAKDLAVRAQKYQAFAHLVNADIAAIFLTIPHYTYAVHEKIKGIFIERLVQPQDRFNTIAEWYTAAGRRWKRSPP